GDEDHLGDMDFKVAGTKDGINAIQMDLKTEGISVEIMEQALEQARVGRIHILDEMLKALDRPRAELSVHAPRIRHLTISTEKIGELIGPGGRVIKAITRDTGCNIDVDDDGVVVISGTGVDDIEGAERMVRLITSVPTVGEDFTATVVRIVDFGAFVAIAPGKEGLVHISQLSYDHVKRVEDVLNMGDKVEVKLIKIDDMGRLDFSRKALLEKPEGYVEPPPRERRPSPGRSSGRFGGGNRGKRR
ncbi:MAG: S1 RNA-binding domain-containing protein, partial [Candidatus Marinimicrobia bacterium]|nr:S1 RNA-binding domain-containing protein [Candidatus Neomarinimicrobiota bacterium]